MRPSLRVIAGAVLALFSGARALAAQDPEARRDELAREVDRILETKCTECHVPDSKSAKARRYFDSARDLARVAEDYVVAGELELSDLWLQIEAGAMPPEEATAGPLTIGEKEVVRAWILEGAPLPSADPPDDAGGQGDASSQGAGGNDATPTDASASDASAQDAAANTGTSSDGTQDDATSDSAPADANADGAASGGEPATGVQSGEVAGDATPAGAQNDAARPTSTRDARERALFLAGRAHPAIVHFPIAFVLGAGFVELFVLVFGAARRAGAASVVLVRLAALSAPIAAAAGWLNALDSSPSETLDLHRWSGIGAAALAVLLLLFSERAARRGPRGGYRLVLLLACAAIGAAGWFGGELVYGEDYFEL